MKELEDYRWFPAFLRNFQTSFIGFVVTRFGFYQPLVDRVRTIPVSYDEMVDLCSGNGQAAIRFFRETGCFTHLTLSDKYPDISFKNSERIVYVPQSTDALEINFQHRKCYTMFNAFHHFSDEDKLRLVKRIIHAGAAGFIVEILESTIICFLKVLLITTVGNLALAPFVKPFSWKRLLFTYLIPVNIITIAYDGVVSVLKSRSVEEYRKLFAAYGNAVMVERLRSRFNPVVVIEIQSFIE